MAQTVWRNKLAVLPVIVLTALGLTYVLVLSPAKYEVTASYVLIPPPFPPTVEERQRDPALAKVRADNPFVRFSASSIVVDLVARHTDSERSREALIEAGADERFTVLPSNRFGFSSPIIDVNAVGSTPESAMSTARLVSEAVERELFELQAKDVDEAYMYRPLLVEFPETARLRISNKLRSAIAVLALGGILSFFAVSLAEALRRRPAGQSSASPRPVRVQPAVQPGVAVHAVASHSTPVSSGPVHLAPDTPQPAAMKDRVRGAHYRRAGSG